MGDSIVGYFVRFLEGEPARSAAQLAAHRAHATTTALWLHPTRGFIRRGGFSGRSDSLAEIGADAWRRETVGVPFLPSARAA